MNAINGRTNRSEELDLLKQIFRSIIQSNGNQITIRRLLREYKELNGFDVPIDAFNCESVVELIHQMDDSFRIEIQDKHRNGLDYMVYCLSDPNTQHLVDLIQNQRQDKNQNKEVLNPFPNVFRLATKANQRPKTLKPYSLDIIDDENDDDIEVLNITERTNWKKRENSSKRRTVCPLPDSRVIPHEEKRMICELMSKYNSLNILNFPSIYRILHKRVLEFERFGYKSCEEFLKQMPESVRLDRTSDGITVKATEALLSSTQTTNGSQTKEKSVKQSKQKNGFCSENESSVLVKLNPKRYAIKPNQLTNGLSKTDSKPISESVNEVNDNNRNKLSNGLYGTDRVVSFLELRRFRHILRKYRNGIPANQFTTEYYQTYGQPLIADQWGYGSPIEMFAHLTKVFYLKESQNGSKNMDEWLLMESTPELVAQSTRLVPKRKPFDSEFKKNVLNIMLRIAATEQKYLWVEDFADAYYLIFDECIDCKSFGYKGFRELLIDLSHEMDIDVKEKIKNKPFVTYKKKFIDF